MTQKQITAHRIVEYTSDGTWNTHTTRLAVVKVVNENGTLDIRVSRIAAPDLDLKGVPLDRVRLIRKSGS